MGLQDAINATNDADDTAWRARKAKHECECTDRSKFECENFNAPDDGGHEAGEACSCPCHRVARGA